MTFRQRIVRIFACAAFVAAGMAAYCGALFLDGWHGAAMAAAGGAAIGIGLLGIFRAIWAPRAEGSEPGA